MEKLMKVLGSRGRVTIPVEIRREVGFAYNDVLSFEIGEDNTVIVRKEQVCACEEAEEKESLLDFLNRLFPGTQAAILVHLSLKLAERQRNKHVEV